MASKKPNAAREPSIENRRARHDYFITDTLECGIRLTGSEVKSVRDGKVSLAEGFVRAVEEPVELVLHGVHIAEYPPAGKAAQHEPTRPRVLLAHKREIKKLARATQQKGLTLVPLKMYFSKGRAKVLIGLAQGKKQHDQRRAIAAKEAKRDISRAMSRKM